MRRLNAVSTKRACSLGGADARWRRRSVAWALGGAGARSRVGLSISGDLHVINSYCGRREAVREPTKVSASAPHKRPKNGCHTMIPANDSTFGFVRICSHCLLVGNSLSLAWYLIQDDDPQDGACHVHCASSKDLSNIGWFILISGSLKQV